MKGIVSKIDWPLFVPILILLSLGLTMIRSVAPESFQSQLFHAFLGLSLFFLFSRFDPRIYSRLAPHFYFLSVSGLLLTFIFGAITRGAVRWLEIGGLRLQPSELVKPLLILSLAAFLSRRETKNFKSFLVHFISVALPAGLIFAQPDLGSSLVVVFFWLSMLYVSGPAGRLFKSLVPLVFLFPPLSWLLLRPYQRERLLTFLNPFRDPLGSGYNIIQSMVAVGSGGLWGRGLGHGSQSHLQFLPERHTDFIFASLSEELGFLGSLFLVAVYGWLLLQIFKKISRQTDSYPRLIAAGIFSLFFFQFFINVGMNLGLMPVTGITLPLVSYGGSSLLSSLIALGIAASLKVEPRSSPEN